MRLVCVVPDQIEAAWEKVGHHIFQAMTRGGMGDAEVAHRDLLAGDALLWLACEGVEYAAAAVTEVTDANGKKICTITGCGGEDSENWMHLIDGLEAYARINKCAEIRIIGRKGWKRKLPEYRERAVILTKGLS